MAKEYFVYQLVDPRDSKPFYMGSGPRGRPYCHMTEASSGVESEKCDRIREIWAAGLEPVIQLVSEAIEDRQLAYDAENALIKSTPGLTNKTYKNKGLNLWSELGACLLLKREHRVQRLARILSKPRKSYEAKPGWGRLWDSAATMFIQDVYGTKAQQSVH